MSKSQHRIERTRNPRRTRIAAPVVCESLEDRALFSATTTIDAPAATTTPTDSTVATATDVKTNNGNKGLPHGKFGFF